MKGNIIFSLFAAILFIVGNSAFAQVQLLDVRWHGQFVETDSMTISAHGKDVTIQPSGLVRGTMDNKKVKFTLPVDEDYHLASVNWAETDSLHIIFYEESISTHRGTSFVILDKESYKVSERESAGGFNFREPIFKKHFMYLRSIGMVGKYDLKKREYAWVHHDLYNRQRGTFNLIEKPIFHNGKVTFISRNDIKGNVDTLIIEDRSGAILNK